ncbi:hypothetical protein BMF94_4322 [Rhodotorula taiwanensis]|uniref:NADP-dependent oxidoreductase domain-containing protein n=1 Tax=Rhodotorula taiwanensis TaxID=741276 RepID=A0A2S5B6V8_9BASI|nr:hypothetical protein BMF94_4322 [Rhodotorula taiwanensis]
MSLPTVQFAGQSVGKIATGLMRLTWAPKQTPDEQAFELMRVAIEEGATFFNSGVFYGNPPDATTNLQLISRFCEAHPDLKDKFVLSVKGGIDTESQWEPTANIDFLRAEVEKINRILKHRKMDMFEVARIDQKTGIEGIMKNLLTLRDEGHFKYISLSEVGAATIRKAASIGPVSCVEVEYSPFTTDIERNGVLDACKELNIPIAAYSPLGAGFLGNNWKSKEDIPEGDHRRTFDKFSDEHFEHNMQLVKQLEEIAKKRNVTAAQLSIAWVGQQWEGILPLPGSTNPDRVKQCIEAGKIRLSDDELKQIRSIIDNFDVKGVRYDKGARQAHLFA